MCAHALHHERRTGVAHAEALAGEAVRKAAPSGCAIEGHVAHDDVLVELERRALRRTDRDDASREPLAKVVVRIAANVERDARWQEGSEALPGRAVAIYGDGAVRQPFGMGLRDLVAQKRAHAAVDVGNVRAEVHRAQVRAGILRIRYEERRVERALHPLVRGHSGQVMRGVGARDIRAELAHRGREHRSKVDEPGLPIARRLNLAQALHMAHHLVYRGETSRAMTSRSCSATKSMKRSTCSGLPAKPRRRRQFCVAMPAGQVSC